MDRKQFEHSEVNVKETLPWTCPACNSGVLLINGDTFSREVTAEGHLASQLEEFESDWIQYTFSTLLSCSNSLCKECVACIGDYRIEANAEIIFEDGVRDYRDIHSITPKFFFPKLNIITVPDRCPEKISRLVNSAMELFFADPNATGNKLRKCVEVIVSDYYGIEREATTSETGETGYLSLHSRIQKIPTTGSDKNKNKEVKSCLTALKWLGNDGSHHEEKLTRPYIIDAFEIIEQCLLLLYGTDDKARITERVRSINRKKGV